MDHHLRIAILLAGNLVIIIILILLFIRRREPEVRKKHLCRSYIDLPREITFNILILLPANVLHEVARKVCKQWDEIIKDPVFVRAHCQISTTRARFLVQVFNKLCEAYYMEAECTKSVRVTEIKFPSPARISGSYNGLVLLSDRMNKGVLHLMNLVTKVIVSLPRLRALNSCYYVSDNLAVDSYGRYKAVRVSDDVDHKKFEMHVFTVGVDKAWRRVEIPEANCVIMLELAFFVPGFMYWCADSCRVCFAMDVDTETIYQFYGPKSFDIFLHFPVHYISLGTGLGVTKEEDKDRGIWSLWKLTDVKSSKWTEVAMIDIGAIVRKVYKRAYDWLTVIPVSLIDGELCFKYCVPNQKYFQVGRYNLANKGSASFRVKTVSDQAYVCPHVPTLVSARNC
ncbi:uncharacterized protein LOC141655773 [Silene latifolia]|uniref:uncharacterized protein LOC141655773 n=1 Tax=Silene latifolia TaxID=37657 RepID=UPI003D773181